MDIRKYHLNWWIGLDQWINTWFAGDPDETISSRCGKSMRRGNPGPVTKALAKFLDFIDPNHCEDAIEEDEGKDATN